MGDGEVESKLREVRVSNPCTAISFLQEFPVISGDEEKFPAKNQKCYKISPLSLHS